MVTPAAEAMVPSKAVRAAATSAAPTARAMVPGMLAP
jgi:hypothetical protein